MKNDGYFGQIEKELNLVKWQTLQRLIKEEVTLNEASI
jgi:hypothetical protein